MQKEIKRKATAYGILAVLLATTLGVVSLNFGIWPLSPPSVKAQALSTFSSYEELENYLRANQETPYYQLTISDMPRILLPPGEIPSSASLEVRTLGGMDVNTVVPKSGPEYSKTNVQVAGVDEADIVKTDEEYMFIASGNNVTILKAYPAEEAQILSQISLNGTVRGIFINGDKLAVFGESYFYQPVEAYNVTVTDVFKSNETAPLPVQQVRILPSSYLYATGSETFIKVYNVSDRANPSLTSEVATNGSYFSSRMIGDYVYAVTSQPTLWLNSRVILPTIVYLNETKTIQPTEIYYSNVSDNSYAFTTIVALNIKLDTEPVHKTYLLGSASNMYASLNNIYITMLKQGSYENSWTETTLIHRVHMQDGEIEVEANGEVPGRELNQFSMDEYNGYFRIATIKWAQGPQNNVYVLDMNLNIVGRLENFAPPEEAMDSARFIGDRCYLATSVIRRDPFFVIDLINPTHPKVLGYLKIPGFTKYLHPYDENHIIGIGMDEGKVKISLFDVSNVSDPKEKVPPYKTDEGSNSIVLDDHKAFLFDKSRNLLVMPITEYKDYGWQGAYVFNITIEQIELRGIITHMENDTGDVRSYYYSNYVVRSLYIDDVLYTISASKVKMNNLETLAEINEIELP